MPLERTFFSAHIVGKASEYFSQNRGLVPFDMDLFFKKVNLFKTCQASTKFIQRTTWSWPTVP